MRKLLLLIGLLVISLISFSQTRLISTEKSYHVWLDTTFTYKETVQYDCIFEIDAINMKFYSIAENNRSYLDIVNIEFDGNGIYRYKLTKNGKFYTIIVDYQQDIIKTMNKDAKRNFYATSYRIDKIEIYKPKLEDVGK